MYKVDVTVKGVSPLLQHAFGQEGLRSLQEDAKKRTGRPDYSMEWMDTMHVGPSGLICEPANHIEGALVKAATSYIMRGRKTWKDSMRAYAYVSPDMIPLLWDGEVIPAPGPELLEEPTEALSVDIRRVVVNRSAVARARLKINEGWMLRFQIEVIDPQLPSGTVYDILCEAGRAQGIGDFRPRNGRFDVVDYQVLNGA